MFLKIAGELERSAEERGVSLKVSRLALIVSSLLLPILPLNVVALGILQSKVNKLYDSEILKEKQ